MSESVQVNDCIPQDLLDLKAKFDRGELVEMKLRFQNYIETAPVTSAQLHAQAASSDGPTIAAWRDTWIRNIQTNYKKYGGFAEHSIGKLFNANKYRPAIIAGSGPSLKKNGHLLKDRGDIPLVSCLHNFHFFEDQGIHVDYYVTLDAGPVTVEEVSEGGAHEPSWYWERTRGKKLIAFIGTHPELLEKWQGEVFFFTCPLGDKTFNDAMLEMAPFEVYLGTGGNVLGACLYFAKGWLGSNPIAFTGADFAFSYMNKFHGWDSKYDAHLGQVIKCMDIYGNKVLSWQSYNNFKAWFDQVCMDVPGIWINCSEGGTLGAYFEGNIMAIKQMTLASFLDMYEMSRHLLPQAQSASSGSKAILF